MEEIGKRIRELRQDKRLTLEELSSRTDLSKSYISEAERGIASLSITALQKIAQALEVPLSHFFLFPPPAPEPHMAGITRAGKRSEFRMEANEDRTFVRLAANFPGCVLEPILTTIYPDHSRVEPYSHPGEEFVYVLEGTLTVLVREEEFELGPGDTIHMPSVIPHNWENRTGKPVRIIAVSTPKIF
ncbi:MAG: cupin domain-containing protein [Ignavibacteriales bacterium]